MIKELWWLFEWHPSKAIPLELHILNWIQYHFLVGHGEGRGPPLFSWQVWSSIISCVTWTGFHLCPMAADSVLIVGGPGSWILVKVLFEKSYPLAPAKTGVIFPWRVQETSLDNCSKSREILRRTLGPNLTVWSGIERFFIHTWLNITLNPTTLDSVLLHCIPFHTYNHTPIHSYINKTISIHTMYICIYIYYLNLYM